MHRSAEYRDWRKQAGWVIRSQKPGSIKGRVFILLAIERCDLRSDIDNRVKAIFDAIAEAKVIENDKYVVAFCVCWSPPGSNVARVLVLPAGSRTFKFLLAPDGATGGFFLTDEDEDGDFPEYLEEDVG